MISPEAFADVTIISVTSPLSTNASLSGFSQEKHKNKGMMDIINDIFFNMVIVIFVECLTRILRIEG
jgi:hypothetical protein